MITEQCLHLELNQQFLFSIHWSASPEIEILKFIEFPNFLGLKIFYIFFIPTIRYRSYVDYETLLQTFVGITNYIIAIGFCDELWYENK